jgi:hypothetical protein
MFDIIGNVLDSTVKKVDNFIDNPVGETIDYITAPVKDAIDVIDGLTEGELRVYAAARLGMDVVSGMACSELIDWYNSL